MHLVFKDPNIVIVYQVFFSKSVDVLVCGS